MFFIVKNHWDPYFTDHPRTLFVNFELFYLFRETPVNHQLFHLRIQAQSMAHLLMMGLSLQADWPKTVRWLLAMVIVSDLAYSGMSGGKTSEAKIFQ
jgi:hypothetical protein